MSVVNFYSKLTKTLGLRNTKQSVDNILFYGHNGIVAVELKSYRYTYVDQILMVVSSLKVTALLTLIGQLYRKNNMQYDFDPNWTVQQ